jgi:hypothetical protein
MGTRWGNAGVQTREGDGFTREKNNRRHKAQRVVE